MATGSLFKGKPRLCKVGHARFRKAIYMPALVLTQCNPVIIVFYNCLKEKRQEPKSDCLCDYEETGPYYFRHPEIRREIRFKL